MILHRSLQWMRQNINQSFNTQKTPHTAPWRVSYGCPLWRFWRNEQCYNGTWLYVGTEPVQHYTCKSPCTEQCYADNRLRAECKIRLGFTKCEANTLKTIFLLISQHYIKSNLCSSFEDRAPINFIFISLAPGRSECDSKNVNFNLVLLIGIFRSSHDNALWWMPQDPTDDKSRLVQLMAWCRQATNHYLSQCWLSSLSPYGIARPQWVK